MDLFEIVSVFIVFLVSISFHESAHALVGYLLGDRTAKNQGRISLNPFRHIDPIGTIVLPLIGLIMPSHSFFGWAKPTPYDPRNLKDGHKDEIFIALAGPLSNLLLALISVGLFYFFFWAQFYLFFPKNVDENIIRFISIAINENLLLTFFNLIPMPPLDGSSLLKIFLPRSLHYQLNFFNRYGFLFLIMISQGPFGDIVGNYLDMCTGFCLKIVGLE